MNLNNSTTQSRGRSASRTRTSKASTGQGQTKATAPEAAETTEKQLPPHLVNEIDELIEKEKTLLELKLLDKQLETENWKTKYTDLKEKVLEEVNENEQDIDLLGKIADIETHEAKNFYIPTDANILLAARIEGNVANFSETNFTRAIFFNVMRELFSPKTNNFPFVNVLLIDNCSVDSDYADAVYNALKNPKLEAIDLSHNFINGEMMFNIVSILANRRRTPQYLLLHANMPYAVQAKTFTDILKVLSEDTWGLSLSLQDYPSNPGEIFEKRALLEKKKRKHAENVDYGDLVKPPFKIFHFLKALNEQITTGRREKDKLMNFQSSKKAANRPGQIIQRTVGIFKSLVVLGITDCHMSKQSIELLADTCELLRDTLTDLDLSYSYLGLYGLKTIKQILTDPESQLINLNLKGNVLCEQGALGVSESLKKNKTLTYLNLSSNEIPITAIRTMLNHLAKSSTLFEVDLRRNDFTIDDIDDIEYKLKDNGSIVNFVFDKINRQDSFLMSLLEVDPKFYCLPQLQRKFCTIGKAKTIINIDISRLSQQYPKDYFQQPMIVHFFFRPWPLISFQNINKTIAKSMTAKVPYVSKTYTVRVHADGSQEKLDRTQVSKLNQTFSSTGITTKPLENTQSSGKKSLGKSGTFAPGSKLEEEEQAQFEEEWQLDNEENDNEPDENNNNNNNTKLGTNQPGIKKITKKILMDDPFLYLSTFFDVFYEVQYISQQEILYSYEKQITFGDFNPRAIFNDNVPWHHYYEIIPAKYLSTRKGQFKIRIKCIPTEKFLKENYEFDSTVRALCFQLKSCVATRLLLHAEKNGSGFYYLGGDGNEFETNPLSIQYTFEKETEKMLFDDSDEQLFQDHTLLRSFQYLYQHISPVCKLSWQSKLFIKHPEGLKRRNRKKLQHSYDPTSFKEESEENDDDFLSAPSTYMNRLDYSNLLDYNYWNSFPAAPQSAPSTGTSMNSTFHPSATNTLGGTSSRRPSGTATSLGLNGTSSEKREGEGGTENLDEEALRERLEQERIEEEQEDMYRDAYFQAVLRDLEKKPKHFEFITYEWTVSVLELMGNRRIIKTFCCDYQIPLNDDDDDDDDDHPPPPPPPKKTPISYDLDTDVDGSTVPRVMIEADSSVPQIIPWMWERFEIEVDDLQPGDVILLSGRIVQKDYDEIEREFDEMEGIESLYEKPELLDLKTANLSSLQDNGVNTTNNPAMTRRMKRKSKLPKQKDLSKLMENISIQVKNFESYLFVDDLEKVPVEELAATIPFVHPPTSIYVEPAIITPFEREEARAHEIYNAEDQITPEEWDRVNGKTWEQEHQLVKDIRECSARMMWQEIEEERAARQLTSTEDENRDRERKENRTRAQEEEGEELTEERVKQQEEEERLSVWQTLWKTDDEAGPLQEDGTAGVGELKELAPEYHSTEKDNSRRKRRDRRGQQRGNDDSDEEEVYDPDHPLEVFESMKIWLGHENK